MCDHAYRWEQIILVADEWRSCLGTLFEGRLVEFRPLVIDPLGRSRFRELTHQLIMACKERGIDVAPLRVLTRMTKIETLPESAWDCVSDLYEDATKEGRVEQGSPKISEDARRIMPSIRTLPLPEELKPLFSRACQLILARPDDFKPVGKWLDEHYSEGVLRSLCEQTYRQDFAYRLRLLRRDGSGNFALSTHKRRLALQCGRSREELMRETIEEARLRGYRFDGTRYVGRSHPDQYPDEKRIDEGNYELVWLDEDERYRRSRQKLRAERKSATMKEYDHPERFDWRLERAVGEIMEAEYPDGTTEHIEHSRRVVGIAALLICPELLPTLGEFGQWEWNSRADPSTDPTGDWLTDVLRTEAQSLEKGAHKRRPGILHPRRVGREEVLFHRTPGEQRKLWNKWGDLSTFCELLAVAVDELESSDEKSKAALAQAAAHKHALHATPKVEALMPIGYMGIDALCQHFKIPADKRDALRKRLERFRRDHAGDGEAFTEHDCKARNESRYLYNPAKIKEHLQDLST